MRLLAFLLLALGAATSAAAQNASSLAGTWQLVYTDSALGNVGATVIVRPDGELAPVRVHDPRNGAQFVVVAKVLRQAGDELVLELDGRLPSASAAPARAGQPVAAPGGHLSLELGGASLNVAPVPSEPAWTDRLRLKLKRGGADNWTGSWEVTVDAVDGRDGRGAGPRGVLQRDPTGAGRAWQSGVATLNRVVPTIDFAVAVGDQAGQIDGVPFYPYPFDAAGNVDAAHAYRTLLLVGSDFPHDPGDPVELTSETTPQIAYSLVARGWEVARSADQYGRQVELGMDVLRRELPAEIFAQLKHRDVMLVRASLSPGALPGLHGLALNGGGATWKLEFGDFAARLVFSRPVAADFEATRYGFRPEALYLELVADHPLPLNDIPLLLAVNGKVIARSDDSREIVAHPVPGDPLRWRSEAIWLQGDTPLGGGANKLILPVRPGDVLTAGLARDGQLIVQPDGARLEVLDSPDQVPAAMLGQRQATPGITFRRALRQAAQCAQQDPGQDPALLAVQTAVVLKKRVLASVVTDKPVTREVPVTLQDHAAMILLKHRLITLLQVQRRAVAAIDSAEKRAVLLRRLTGHVGYDNAFLRQKIKAPDGSDSQFVIAFLPAYLKQKYGLDGAAADAFRQQAVVEALASFRASLDAAIAHAQGVGDCAVEDLLDLTGTGFEPVAASLLPEQLVPGPATPTGEVLWAVDPLGRGGLQGVAKLAQDWREARDTARLENQVILIAIGLATGTAAEMIPVAWVAAGAAAFDLGSGLYSGYTTWHDFKASAAEIEFARGASALLGTARLDQAIASRVIWIELAQEVVNLGLAGLSSFNGFRRTSELLDIAEGKRLFGRLRAPEDFLALPSPQRRLVLLALAEAKYAEFAAGRQALTAAEKLRARFADDLQRLWQFGPGREPTWAARFAGAERERLKPFYLRSDIARLAEQDAARLSAWLADDVAYEALRATPFVDTEQMEGVIKKARQRVVNLGRSFFDAYSGALDEQLPANVSIHMNVEDRVADVTLGVGTPYGLVSVEATRARSLAPLPGAQREMVVFSIVTTDRLGDAPAGGWPRFALVPNAPLVPGRGTPLIVLANLQAIHGLGVGYGDPAIGAFKLSTVVNANAAIQLHWLRKVYPGRPLNELMRLTDSFKYAETALSLSGFRITGTYFEFPRYRLREAAGSMVADDAIFYDHEIPGLNLLRQYDVDPDEIIDAGFDYYIFVEPRADAQPRRRRRGRDRPGWRRASPRPTLRAMRHGPRERCPNVPTC